MTASHDRREFLKRLGRSAVYAAPVVASFRAARAQDSPGNSSSMNPNDGGHGDPMMAAAYQPSPGTNPPPGGKAPWAESPGKRRAGP